MRTVRRRGGGTGRGEGIDRVVREGRGEGQGGKGGERRGKGGLGRGCDKGRAVREEIGGRGCEKEREMGDGKEVWGGAVRREGRSRVKGRLEEGLWEMKGGGGWVRGMRGEALGRALRERGGG